MSNRLLNIKVPDSWEIRKLKEISNIVMGQSPPSSTYNINSDGLPFFQGNADFGYYNPEVRIWCNSPKKIAQPNDILVSVRAPVGAVNIADVKSCIGRGLSAVRVNNGYDMKYIYYFLNHFNKVFNRLKQGSTFEAITKEELVNLPVLLPQKFKEQKQLSSILYNVDELIFKTQDLIKYFQILKKGLMQRLFTEGIGHSEFKETRMGRIPKDWEEYKLDDLILVKSGKRLPKGEPFSDEITSYPYIRVIDFYNGSIKTENLKYLTHDIREKIKKYIITVNDIYLSIAGTIGLVGTIPPELNGANLTENAVRLVIKNNNLLDKEFLAYFIASDIGQRRIKRRTTLTSQPKLAIMRIKKIPVALPSFLEQLKIAKIIKNVDNKIMTEEFLKNKLQNTKKGLMQDLLTGKKRVKIN